MAQNEKRLKNVLPDHSLVGERIALRYGSLTGALRQFADFVLSEPLRVARMSMQEAVNQVGVSVATANRFSTAIGFAGYAEFRAELIRSFETIFAPVEQLRAKVAEGASPADVVAASLREDMDNLQSTLAALNPASIDRFVDRLIGARNVFILGFENAGHLAGIFAAGLDVIGRPARVVENGAGRMGAARQLFTYGPEDLVVAIAFSLYMRDTIDMARYAHTAKIPIVAITDRLNSPLVQLSETALFVTADHAFNPPSDAAILSLIEALIAGVASRLPDVAENNERFAAFCYPWMMGPGRDGD